MKKQNKISKGYRLYPDTHKKITKIKKLLNSDTDKAVFTACAYYIENILKNNNKLK